MGKTVAVKKEKAKKDIFLRLAVVAFGVYTIATLVTQQIEIREQKAYLENIQQQCEAQEMENLEVERLLSQGDDESYVEKVARDKLDYAYPDEKVFVDASGSWWHKIWKEKKQLAFLLDFKYNVTQSLWIY